MVWHLMFVEWSSVLGAVGIFTIPKPTLSHVVLWVQSLFAVYWDYWLFFIFNYFSPKLKYFKVQSYSPGIFWFSCGCRCYRLSSESDSRIPISQAVRLYRSSWTYTTVCCICHRDGQLGFHLNSGFKIFLALIWADIYEDFLFYLFCDAIHFCGRVVLKISVLGIENRLLCQGDF